MRRRHEIDALAVRALLARLGEDAADPTEAQLRAAARRAASEGRRPEERPIPAKRRPWRPLRLRWTIAAAAALLVATGLGFGFGTWLTPAGSAGSPVTGFGFLPAAGWSVVQAGLPGQTEATRAIAANVELPRADARLGLPLQVLDSWPPGAIVIVATFHARGDPARDTWYPVRAMPLRFADASPVTLLGQQTLDYVLRAGVRGYNVDVSVTFGSDPTPATRAQAERQIARLVVAPSAVTLAVRPTIYGRDPLVVYGSVTSGRADEKVTVQFKQCGLAPTQFRDHLEVTTGEGGGWSTQTGIAANGVFRAVSGGDISNEVAVKARADVRLQPTPDGRYEVNVVARWSFWRKKVVIQRFDRRSRTWRKLQTMVLDKSGAGGGSAFVWSSTRKFSPKVPKGTTIRAVLPLDQAKPCFIAGYSNLLVTK